ncbi:MAG: hypothetical protein ABI704_25050 [Kofleriaceae bacterium]
MRLATTLLLLTITGTAWAGDAVLDPTADAKKPPEPAAATSDTAPAITNPDDVISYGVDLRLRNERIPTALLELFVNRAGGDSVSSAGYGVDFIRRKGTTEISLGFEYTNLNPGEGVYVEKSKSVPSDPADLILSPDHTPGSESFGWFTVEFNFASHVPINKYVSFRWGLGAGLGIITGGLYRWDVACGPGATNDNLTPGCLPGDVSEFQGVGTGHTSNDSSGAQELTPVKYDLPPVFPVIDAFVGFQFHPVDKVVINVEGGLHTLPYFGLSVGYFIN